MSSPAALLPLLLLLLLLCAVASAGPLELPEGFQVASTTPAPPQPATAPAGGPEEQAVPAATFAPPAEGQYCTVEGAVFHNGARLPGVAGGADPCRACYCQGGEAVCTRVHCYRRTDCAPRHVPGSCCPKYDNCPPEERVPEPRFKEASTQTDVAAASEAPEDTTTTTQHTTVTTTGHDEQGTESTSVTLTTTTSDSTATSTTTTGVTGTATTPASESTTSTSESTTSEANTSSSEEYEAATSAYPPGIDLHALHEHLPFLSPGDANGPNT